VGKPKLQATRLFNDLWAATWLVVPGLLGAAFTIGAIVTWVAGSHLATPWLLVAALALFLLIVATAYVRAARERDEALRAKQPDSATEELRAELEQLRRDSQVIDGGTA